MKVFGILGSKDAINCVHEVLRDGYRKALSAQEKTTSNDTSTELLGCRDGCIESQKGTGKESEHCKVNLPLQGSNPALLHLQSQSLSPSNRKCFTGDARGC